MRKCISLLVVALAVTPVLAEDITIENPSFEIGTFANGDTPTLTSGWFTVSGVSFEDQTGNFQPGEITGVQVAAINSNGAADGSQLYQLVELDAGVTYTLSADLGRRLDHNALGCALAKWSMVLYTNDFGSLLTSTTGTMSLADAGLFKPETFSFSVGSTGTYFIGIRGSGYDTLGGTLNFGGGFAQLNVDNVALVAVPEPAAAALLLGMGAFVGRRRRI